VKSPRLKWLAAAAVLLIATTSLVVYSRKSGAVQYVTTPVDRGDIVAGITATGNTNAVKTVQVGSQVSGNILALYADFNTKVKAGQLVAKIDPAIFQAKVDQAKASVDSANAAVITARANLAKADSDIANAQAAFAAQQANLIKAQSTADDAKLKNGRRIALLKEGLIAQEDADTAKSTYDQAVASVDAAKQQAAAAQSGIDSAKAEKDVTQAQIQTAQAQVKQAAANLKQTQLDLDHTNIIAPVDGTVISRNMDVGQTVAASFQAPTIFQIAQDLTKMQVDTNVDESDVAPVRVSQQATFTVDAYPGVVFQGEVAQIRQAPINVQNVITYDVVVQVANDDLKLFPGMTANVKIVTGQASNVLRMPVAALRFRPPSATATPGGQSGKGKGQGRTRPAAQQATQTIYVLDQNQPKPVRVQLGLSDGNYVEVRSGLNDGQAVLTGVASKTAAPAAQAPGNAGSRRFGF
jgi:HlyD family secretion protein